MQLRMPAEWEPHTATWIAWPHNREDWPGKFEPIPWVYAEIVRHLAHSERVEILVQTEALKKRVRQILADSGVDLRAVRFHATKTDRVWTRDSAPIFVYRGRGAKREVVALNWKFNAWAKYANWRRDDAIGAPVARSARARLLTPETEKGKRIVLEGGSIDVNGNGLMLTTEECLLSKVQARNPNLSRTELEAIFQRYLGVNEVIWLKRGIAGDDTHGHIDDLARFVNRDTVVVASESHRADENFEPLRENFDLLRRWRGARGQRLNVIKLPMPAPVHFEGIRLPASYANFYIANRAVLVPVFSDPNDRLALEILSKCFPRRNVIGIYSRDLVWGLGTIHCMTQQQPRANLAGRNH